MRFFCLALVFISISTGSLATTFIPVSIKKQIKESGKIVEGRVISQEAKREKGMIVSSIQLLADKWVGIQMDSDIINVHFPGGQMGDEVYKVEGSPEFELGEKVVLMLVEQDGKFWVNNLGLGKYSIRSLGKQDVLVNQIFPNHPKVGQISVDKFHRLTEWVTKKKFKERFKDKYEINKDKAQRSRVMHRNLGRSVASFEDVSRGEKESIPAIWLVFILGILGGIVRIIRRNST